MPMFIQSPSVSSIIATQKSAATTKSRRVFSATLPASSLSSSLLLLLCVFLLLLDQPLMTKRNFVMALDWQQVKPMYLVSMYPAPHSMPNLGTATTSSSSSSKSTSSSASTSLEHNAEVFGRHDINSAMADEDVVNDEREPEPLVLNLETTPLIDSMLPEGTMAMDRIFGGNVGNPHCFPYQVGMLLQRPKGLYWCGGSLISDQFVLTAAHCVDMAKRALVFLGANEIKNAKEKGQVRVMVHSNDFIIYPTWNPKRLKDDIALVRLPHAISFNERIHPIQLPKRHYEYRSFKNKLAIASGWGRYATGVHAISNVLRYVQLQIIDGRTCKRNFPLSYRATNICTSGRNSKSTCNGDSGGPLVLQRKHSKKRVLVGVTSFGSIYGCDRGYPAAFTKVASYLDWISDEAGVHPHHGTTEAFFFDKYVKNNGKIRKQTTTERRRHRPSESYFDDDMPDELDVLTSKPESSDRQPGHTTHTRARDKARHRSKSAYEYYLI